MNIYQGSSYNLPIKLTINGEPITNRDVQKVQFAFSEKLIKTYPDEATWDGEKFIVSLTQEETLALDPVAQLFYQARIWFNDGTYKPTKPKPFGVIPAVSKEVLK